MISELRLARGQRMTLVTTEEFGPYGECNTEVNFIYLCETAREDEAISFIGGQFHYNGHWIEFDKECAANIHNVDELCLEYAVEQLGQPDIDADYDRLKEEIARAW